MKTYLDCYPYFLRQALSPAPIFFLLQAKCSVIARNLGVDEGSVILKRQKSALTTHV